MNAPGNVQWTEAGTTRSARWRSESGAPPPRRVRIADDDMAATAAYRLACEGTALLWRGDFHNGRQLLQAMARRCDRRRRKPAPSSTAAFHLHRRARSQRARTLGMVLVQLDADYVVGLRRAPDVRRACAEAYGESIGSTLVSLRELLGLIGAREWRAKGIEIPAAGGRIHPHYGVFSPTRGEYVTLVAEAPLPSRALAFDVGTGTGVLAAVLARRGVKRIVATDRDSRALACARENLARLGMIDRVEVVERDLFPPGRAPLVVCNPPWIPANPTSPLETALYDKEGRMLRGFLVGLADHLTPGGEGWLVLSDLAEHLGLRPREELLATFEDAGLRTIARLDTRPKHRRISDTTDPLHDARAAETTSLWRLTTR